MFASGYLLFSAFLSWRLGTAGDAVIAWGLFAVQLGNVALCLIYFGPVQAIFAAACAICVGAAAWQTRAV